MSSAIHATCDVGIAKAAECRSQPRYPRLVLATTILASSLAFIDGSVVNVGLPAISGTFHAGAEDLQWAHRLYGVERDAFGDAIGAADIALVDVCEKRLCGRPTAGESRRHRTGC